MKNDQWLKEIKIALQDIYPVLGGLNGPIQEFGWNSMYQVAASGSSEETIKQIFGKSLKGRIKNFGRNIFKFNKPISIFSAHFPEDAIIFFKPGRQRIIMASKRRNLLLKLVVKQDQFELFDEEIRLLKDLENTAFAKNVATLIPMD